MNERRAGIARDCPTGPILDTAAGQIQALLTSMSGRIVLTYHPLYEGRGFSPVSRSWSRYRSAWDLLDALGLLQTLRHVQQRLARPEDLLPVHPEEYIDFVRRRDRDGTGYLDKRETPAWSGVFDRALAAVGGTLEAVEMVLSGEATHVFNPSGGLHHAHRQRTAGFCIFNDLVLAVGALQAAGIERIAIVDVDGHHGDGTQELLYGQSILKISLHQYDGRFFPGTGSVDEVGWGGGYGYNVNVGLPRHAGDSLYLSALQAVVPLALRAYRPEVLLLNFGVDGHFADPLVRLGLTTDAYRTMAATLHALSHELCGGRLIVCGSGGYDPEHVARCWSTLIAVLAEELPAPPEQRQLWPDRFAVLEDPASPMVPTEHTTAMAEQAVAQVRRSVLPLRLVA
jgi:acetoin utilization protein AcuC